MANIRTANKRHKRAVTKLVSRKNEAEKSQETDVKPEKVAR